MVGAAEGGVRPEHVYGGPHGAIAQLQSLESWFELQREFHFYSSSVLILYEGGATGEGAGRVLGLLSYRKAQSAAEGVGEGKRTGEGEESAMHGQRLRVAQCSGRAGAVLVLKRKKKVHYACGPLVGHTHTLPLSTHLGPSTEVPHLTF